ncbi:MAG TPA: phage holin family protein [Chloroflexia bacterium]|nr:phage holin family protein [Chloroflexia bacterium]
MQQQTRSDRSLGDLFGDLSKETTTLVRQEVALAKTELTQKATQVGKDVGFLAIGGAVAYAGFLAIGAAVIIALASLGLPWWLSALLVGLVVAGIGYYLVQKGISEMRRTDLTPRQTVETLKEDAEWAKEQTH